MFAMPEGDGVACENAPILAANNLQMCSLDYLDTYHSDHFSRVEEVISLWTSLVCHFRQQAFAARLTYPVEHSMDHVSPRLMSNQYGWYKYTSDVANCRLGRGFVVC